MYGKPGLKGEKTLVGRRCPALGTGGKEILQFATASTADSPVPILD
jgi:hypothetical protein